MSRTTAANFSGGLAFPYATAGTDLFKKEDVQVLAQAVDAHDHTTGKGALITTTPADASITNAKLGPDVARANLLTNGGFEQWQRGVTFSNPASGAWTADRWQTSLNGGSAFPVFQQDTVNVDASSHYAVACSYTHVGQSFLFQKLEDLWQLRGRTLTLSFRIRCNTANAVRAFFQLDGSTNTYSVFHSGGNTYETLTVSLAIPTGTTSIAVGVAFNASVSAAYLDNANLVVGSQAADYAPLHPADDLARCLRYYEILGGDANLDIYIVQNATGGAQNLGAPLSFASKKAVLPTFTKVGTWGVNNCGQPSVAGSRSTAQLLATSTAAGLMTFNTTGTSTYITAEANS
jgi:hypothetical protein